mmetsp:Transcript_4954/g.8267  ORF Transcript_4954/g.8267 Transcript_4954/m.8267 type:complete len:133 (-) Transcript_4954:276-674(-)
MLRFILLAIAAVSTAAFQASMPVGVATRAAAITMNTQYTVEAGLAKKKNPKAGRGALLKGYTVGSLAPPSAVSSGTRISDVGTSYGIGSRFGYQPGKKSAPSSAPAESKSANPALLFSLVSVAAVVIGASGN